MSESAKVRLVRCPKCEKLLPEVTNYSVYQCGGCGAVLRAKNKGVDLDSFSETSDEGRFGATLEKLSDRYEKFNVSEKRMSDGSESDARSIISSSSRGERSRRRTFPKKSEIYSSSLMKNEKKSYIEAHEIPERISDELQRATVAQDFEHLTKYDEDVNLRRSAPFVDDRNGEKSEDEFLWRAQRIDNEVMRYGKEGPSNLLSRSKYESENPNDMNGFNNVDCVGEDRMALLKQIDELKDQLNRSGNLIEKGKEKVPFDRRPAHQDPYVGMSRGPGQYSYPDGHFKRQSYQNQYTEPPPLMRREEMDGNGFYPPQYAPNHVQGYGDPSRSQILRRGPYQDPVSYQPPLSHPYKSGPYMDDNMGYTDHPDPYPLNASRHHPSCSCNQCQNTKQLVPPIRPLISNDKYYDVPNDTMFNHHKNPGSFPSREYNQRTFDPPSRSYNPPGHSRVPSDVNSEVDASIRRRPPRLHLASGGQHCRPLAGGAPFLTCCNCFEVLLLAQKDLSKNNKRKKMKCGACSTVIVFVVSGKNLIVSVDLETSDTLTKVDDERDMPRNNGDMPLKQGRTTFSSEDYDNSGYDFERSNKSTEMKKHHSSSAYTSEVEEEEESPTTARKDSNSADAATKNKGPRPLAGSPLQNHFEYSNKFQMTNRSGEGNRSGRSEHEKELPIKNSARQISRKDSSATEIDLSSNEYSNTGTTFDSGEASREGDQLKGSKVAKSFFGGVIKKSYKDSNRSNYTDEEETANVTVNGHLIPDRLIKKAEKVAGPIHPGNYWYDFRAGFWGALGGPCLGIVPPFIDVFNYPMHEHCSGGNTGVFVNGRELSQKDLSLLGGRGLPTESDRSYIVELSGRVLDEDTGEELQSLGKLAPTVEKMKRGFGMRDPNAVAK